MCRHGAASPLSSGMHVNALTDFGRPMSAPHDRPKCLSHTKDGNSMRWPVSSWRVFVVGLLVATTGCVPTQPFYLHEDGDLSHYIDKATAAEHPDLHVEMLQDVVQSKRPLSVLHPDFDNFWDLSLEECVSITLQNTKIFRGGQ